jgi:hypothetical protein
MTAALLDRPTLSADRPALHGSGTLEELLNASFSEARMNGSTECPVCRARMSSTHARAHEAAGSAECGRCGSRLS